MAPLSIGFLLGGVCFYFRNLFFAGSVALKRRSKVMTLVVGADFQEEDLHGILIAAPLYQERCLTHWSFGLAGPKVTYKPIESIPSILTQLLRGKWLLQITRNDIASLTTVQPGIPQDELRTYGIEFEAGILIYSPEALARGAFQKGLSPGLDVFLVMADWTERQTRDFATTVETLKRSILEPTLGNTMREFGAEGMLFSQRESWWFYHFDKTLVEGLVGKSFISACDNVLRLEGIRASTGLALPSAGDALSIRDKSSTAPLVCEVFLEDGHLVTYAVQGKKKKITATPVGRASCGRSVYSVVRAVASWLLPQVVHDRPYARRNLFKFALQYFLTTWYLLGGCVLAAIIVEHFGLGPVGLPVQIVLGITIFSSFLSFCLSIIYLLRGTFARRGFVLPGI